MSVLAQKYLQLLDDEITIQMTSVKIVPLNMDIRQFRLNYEQLRNFKTNK